MRSLIRETLYRGLDVYGETITEKQLSTGKRTAQQSDAERILTREMPQLRIVSDELWAQANAAIDARRPDWDFPSGPEHPLFGVPRDSRGLLTTLFKCGICGAPMHKGGRGGRAYVCSAARKRKCWNRATAEHEMIENALNRSSATNLVRNIDRFDPQELFSPPEAANDKSESRTGDQGQVLAGRKPTLWRRKCGELLLLAHWQERTPDDGFPCRP